MLIFSVGFADSEFPSILDSFKPITVALDVKHETKLSTSSLDSDLNNELRFLTLFSLSFYSFC